jgi:hypothetical protein
MAFITIKQYADQNGFNSVQLVYYYIKSNRLKAKKIGRNYIISEKAKIKNK